MNSVKKVMIDDLDLKGKRVLTRVDFNVPLDDSCNITDDIRIKAALSTIDRIVKEGGKAVLMSHLGRPKGNVVDKMRLAPAAERLSSLLGRPVKMAPDSAGSEVEKMVNSMQDGDCVLLENLRFYKGETDNDPEFAEKLSKLGDVYVNDAFGTAHRAHASTEGVTKFFDICASGYLMQKEILYLANALDKPKRPFVAVIGGAKISGKIEVIGKLLDKVDKLLIGGGMMFTFLKAKGFEVGDSLLEEDKVELAAKTLEEAGGKLILPTDCVIAESFSADAENKVVPVGQITAGWQGLDIGPETIRNYYKSIIEAETIVWNGPMGVFEMKPFARGTFEVAEAVAESTEAGSVSIIGGGDSSAAIKKAGLEHKITHVSTGGGASLEMLEGKELPGVAALTDKK